MSRRKFEDLSASNKDGFKKPNSFHSSYLYRALKYHLSDEVMQNIATLMHYISDEYTKVHVLDVLFENIMFMDNFENNSEIFGELNTHKINIYTNSKIISNHKLSAIRELENYPYMKKLLLSLFQLVKDVSDVTGVNIIVKAVTNKNDFLKKHVKEILEYINVFKFITLTIPETSIDQEIVDPINIDKVHTNDDTDRKFIGDNQSGTDQ